jgi:hypothetical protein
MTPFLCHLEGKGGRRVGLGEEDTGIKRNP